VYAFNLIGRMDHAPHEIHHSAMDYLQLCDSASSGSIDSRLRQPGTKVFVRAALRAAEPLFAVFGEMPRCGAVGLLLRKNDKGEHGGGRQAAALARKIHPFERGARCNHFPDHEFLRIAQRINR
jgi:hypothetical protein